jgi:hypothetical protein
MSGTPNLDRLYAEIIRDRPDRDRDAAVAEFKRRAKLDEECRREMRRILVIMALLDAANRATS